MTYRPTTEPETWRTLKQIRAELPEGKWGFSRVYEDVNVAIATGHSHDFWDLSESTQAYLIARFRVRGTMEAYEEELSKRKRDKNTPHRPAQQGYARRRRR